MHVSHAPCSLTTALLQRKLSSMGVAVFMVAAVHAPVVNLIKQWKQNICVFFG